MPESTCWIVGGLVVLALPAPGAGLVWRSRHGSQPSRVDREYCLQDDEAEDLHKSVRKR